MHQVWAFLVSSAMAGTILWDGRFNNLTSSTDLNNWSWSNEVGPYQYYIVCLGTHVVMTGLILIETAWPLSRHSICQSFAVIQKSCRLREQARREDNT